VFPCAQVGVYSLLPPYLVVSLGFLFQLALAHLLWPARMALSPNNPLAATASPQIKNKMHSARDVPDFVEVGEAGIAVDDVMRRQRRVQVVG
jgi:hypothetical protein